MWRPRAADEPVTPHTKNIFCSLLRSTPLKLVTMEPERPDSDTQQDAPPQRDATLLLYPCRIALVRAMPACSRACWRLVNKRARDDVFDACIRLRWNEPAMRRHGLLADVTYTHHGQSPPDQLPKALVAKLPALKQLLCHNLDSLTTLDGLPCNLEQLQLSGSTMSGLIDFSPMAACTQLWVLDLHDSNLAAAKAALLATQGIGMLKTLRNLNLADSRLGLGGEFRSAQVLRDQWPLHWTNQGLRSDG